MTIVKIIIILAKLLKKQTKKQAKKPKWLTWLNKKGTFILIIAIRGISLRLKCFRFKNMEARK
jgi:hypothetical protein